MTNHFQETVNDSASLLVRLKMTEDVNLKDPISVLQKMLKINQKALDNSIANPHLLNRLNSQRSRLKAAFIFFSEAMMNNNSGE